MTRIFSDGILAVASSAEFLLVIKATIALALGLTVVRIAGSVRASVRHLILLSSFIALLTLPFAVAFGPTVKLEIPTTAMTSTPTTGQVYQSIAVQSRAKTETPPSTRGNSLPNSIATFMIVVWLAGVAMFSAPFAKSLWRMRGVRRTGVPWLELRTVTSMLANEGGVRSPIAVLLHDGIDVPVTCGWRHPTILIPADARDWPELDVRRALVHELEHIRRADWLSHLLARLICSLYWFHPLVWVAWRQLCAEAERACDDAVLKQAEGTEYAEQLVVLARRLSKLIAPPALSMANRSDLSKRISAILDSNQARGRAGVFAVAVAITGTVAMVLSVAPLRAVAASDARDALVSSQDTGSARLNRALLEAAEDGDVNDITKLLTAGADVNAKFNGDGTALIVAAREGHIAAVQVLLDRGADVDLAVPGDGNALIMAAREGHEDVVKLLLDRGANVDRVVPGDENALIQASGEGHLAIVKLLVSRGADVNARVWVSRDRDSSNGEWRAPLSMARKGGRKSVIEFLMSAGARE